jgi:diguanylate cyclase (GGDEF)-like protein/PAS domain S-box-containing protein
MGQGEKMINNKFWKNLLITTKVGLIISLGIIISISVITIGTLTFLKKEYLAAFSSQQLSTVQAFAKHLDASLAGKLKELKAVADILPQEALLDTSSAQQFLSNRTGIASKFDDGLMILAADGRLLAEIPFISLERLGQDYSFNPIYLQAKEAASPVISKPFYSNKPGQLPIVEFMVPVHTNQGEIAGYLCGGLSLTGDNELGDIGRRKTGDNGYYFLYSQDRTILVHPDSTRILQKDVLPGVNHLFDQALEGLYSSDENINSRGLHSISSFHPLQSASWILASDLPIQEVLAPFNKMRQLILLTILACGAGMLYVSWWSLFHFITPLYNFVISLQTCEGDAIPNEDAGSPEINLVISKCNQMLARLQENQTELHKLAQAVDQSPVSIVITDTQGNIEFVNPQFTRLTGYTLKEARGENLSVLNTDKNHPELFVQLLQTINAGKIWEGEFYNQKKNGEQFIEHAIVSPILNDKGKITHYLTIKEDITNKKQSEEIIWHQANFDHLTQLPNRRLFLDRFKNAISAANREKSSLVLLFLDLDHFKDVNDTLGHDFGDLLLMEAAQRIQECIRDTDTVSRFGGDEFVFLLNRIKIDEDLYKVINKIVTSLSQPFHLNMEEVHISASIGATSYPDDATDLSVLLKNADRAMYLAKSSGRNCWRSFRDVLENAEQKKTI